MECERSCKVHIAKEMSMGKGEKLRRLFLAFWVFPPALSVPHLLLFLLNSEKCESASLPLIKNLALFRATMVTGSKESRRLMAKSLVKNEYSSESIIVALQF